MSAWLIALTGLIYLGVALEQAYKGNMPMFVCLRMERLTGGDILWTREDNSSYGKLLNWVWAKDAEEAN